MQKNRPTPNDVHVPGPMARPKKKPLQKPWTASNVPENLRDWPEAMRARFAEVASEILEETGDEEKAIQAGIAAAMRLKKMIEKANHAYAKCMLCRENPPDNDALWQDEDGGLHRAWMCSKCFPGWYAEKGGMIIHTHAIEGAASKRYRPIRHSPKEARKRVSKDSRFRINGVEVDLETLAKAWLAGQPVAEPEPEVSGNKVEKSWLMEVIEKQEEKQIVFGVILRANTPDSQGDILTPDAIEDIAIKYMANQYGKADWLHQREIPRNEAVLVQSFISPLDFEWNGVQVKKSDWLGGMWIPDKEKWQAVKKGQIKAFSIRGMGRRTPVK